MESDLSIMLRPPSRPLINRRNVFGQPNIRSAWAGKSCPPYLTATSLFSADASMDGQHKINGVDDNNQWSLSPLIWSLALGHESTAKNLQSFYMRLNHYVILGIDIELVGDRIFLGVAK